MSPALAARAAQQHAKKKELHLIKRNIKSESSMQQISKVSLRVASKMGFVFSLQSLLSASLRLIVWTDFQYLSPFFPLLWHYAAWLPAVCVHKGYFASKTPDLYAELPCVKDVYIAASANNIPCVHMFLFLGNMADMTVKHFCQWWSNSLHLKTLVFG